MCLVKRWLQKSKDSIYGVGKISKDDINDINFVKSGGKHLYFFKMWFVCLLFSETNPPSHDIPTTESEGAQTIGTIVAIICGACAVALIIIDIPALYRDISQGIKNASNTKAIFLKWKNGPGTPISAPGDAESQSPPDPVTEGPSTNAPDAEPVPRTLSQAVLSDPDLNLSEPSLSSLDISLPGTPELSYV